MVVQCIHTAAMYLKVCAYVCLVELGSLGICYVKVPCCKQLVAEVDATLGIKLNVAFVISTTHSIEEERESVKIDILVIKLTCK